MGYYILSADARDHIVLGPRDEGLWDFFLDHFDDPAPFVNWSPFEVEPITDHVSDPTKLLGPADIVNFNLTSICLLSERARESLASVLDVYGEFLPVFGLGRTFYLYHVTKVVDALDEARSVVERFSSGRIMRVIKYVLKEDVLGDCDVFRMPTDKWRIFVSDRFVEQVNAAALDGFVFKPLQ